MEQHKFLWIAIVMVIVTIMINVDFTAVNLSIATISHLMHSRLAEVQWILSGYMGAWAAGVVLGGKLSDTYGSKKIFLIGVALFTLASALAGLSIAVWFLILSRCIQGFGAALFVPSAYGLIFTNVDSAKQGQMLGLLGGAVGFGLAVGPTVGGIILHLLSWRWIFFINVPFGIIALMLISSKATQPKLEQAGKINWFAAVCLIGIIFLGLFDIQSVNQHQEFEIRYWLSVIICLSSLFIYVLWQWNSASPFMQFRLFLKREFSVSVFLYIIFQLCFAGVLFVMALYMQNVMGLTGLEAGYAFLAVTIMFGLLSPLSGRLMKKISLRRLLTIGMVALCISCFGLGILTRSDEWVILLIMFLIFGFGLGMTFPALNTSMMNSLTQQDIGVGSGIFTMSGALANSISVNVSALLLSLFSIEKLHLIISEKFSALSESRISNLKEALLYGHYKKYIITHNQSSFLTMLHTSFVFASRNMMLIYFGFAVVGLLGAVFLLKKVEA